MKNRPKDWEAFEEDALREAGAALDALGERRSGCPPLELLHAARAQALPEELQAKVTHHLTSCALCGRLEADLDAAELPDVTPVEAERILARVKSAGSAERARGARAGWNFSWRTAVATLALAAVVVLAVQLATPPGPPAEQPLAVVVPSPHAASVLDLQKPAVKLSVNVLTLRGPGRKNQQDYLKDLAPALDAYRADDYALAAGQFSALAGKYPRSTEVFFYLGVSRLFLKDNAGAVEALKTARELADDSLAPDVTWYYAVALERTGKAEEARSELAPLCEGKSEYAARACAGIKELSQTPAAGTAR